MWSDLIVCLSWSPGRRRAQAGALAVALALALIAPLAVARTAEAAGWSGALRLPVPLNNQVAVTDGTSLYIVGGDNGGAQVGVYSAPIGPSGTLGTWQTITPLPQGLYNHAGVLQNGYVLTLGGQNAANAAQAAVYAAPVVAAGTLGAWSTTTSLPFGLYDLAAVGSGTSVYAIGGRGSNGVSHANIYMAQQSGGSLSTWASEPPLPVPLYEEAATVANGYVYVAGGRVSGGAMQAGVYAAAIGAGGTLGPWQTLDPLPGPRGDVTVAAAGGYLWAVGGYDGSFHATNTVFRAPLNADGTVGSWLALTPLPRSVGEQTLTYAQGYLFVAGNKSGSATVAQAIYVAPTAGPWTMLSSYAVAPGETVQVSGTGYKPGETVKIVFGSTQVATIAADATGSFGLGGSPLAAFTVPTNTPAGTYRVTATGLTSHWWGRAMLKVT